MIKLKHSKFTELCGWYGMAALMAAYILVSFGLISANGLVYQLLNLTGALGLTVIAIAKDVVQSVILNIFWALIGVIVIIRLFF